MENPLNASASSAGALFSSSNFKIPQFQREYAWVEQVEEFWEDLRGSLDAGEYFLGLIILTEDNKAREVVDGQQRLITLSLLATAIHYEAVRRERHALADRIRANFLQYIDYDSDRTHPRITLSAPADNQTFRHIIETGTLPDIMDDLESVSARMAQSYRFLSQKVRDDLRSDPFKRLGKWAEFLTERLYFAVFIHPDPATAYQVFEVINTRGRELTTADLLKNYVLSQTSPHLREERYQQWRRIASNFQDDSGNAFVQYIRHVVTVRSGHILPKDLYSFLASRGKGFSKPAPTVEELMEILEYHLPLYMQMIDWTLPGPAEDESLKIFKALHSLGVIAVRPILLAMADAPDPLRGMEFVLQLVVRRIVVGNLGTGNVERKFGEAAQKVYRMGNWEILRDELADLNPSQKEFRERLIARNFNKTTLAFIRRSILTGSMTPENTGQLCMIWTRQARNWPEIAERDGAPWASTIGNTFLANRSATFNGADSWEDFKYHAIPQASSEEWADELSHTREWSIEIIERFGASLADRATEIWY